MNYITTQLHYNKKMEELIYKAHPTSHDHQLFCKILDAVSLDVDEMVEFEGMILQQKNAHANMNYLLRIKDPLSWEWICNEFYISNGIVDGQWGSAVSCLLDCAQNIISNKFPNCEFCVVISLDIEGCAGITVHCYQFRNGEFYFDNNLDNYEHPILYAIFHSST